MKKYDEGYALAFVMVVMVILCLVAVSILSISLRNLQNQQATVERMQDQYEAEGEIEKFVAALDHLQEDVTSVSVPVDSDLTATLEESSKITLVAESGSVKVTCILVLDAKDLVLNQGELSFTSFTGYSYESYTISATGGDGE